MTSNNELITFDDGKVDLIKRTVAKGATHDELALFLHQAQRMGLDPLARQIHFQKFISNSGEANVAFITTIDGYRLIADRTGRYAGNDEPVFEGRGSGEYRGTYTFPQKATVTVWKIVGGSRVAFSASAYWAEYYPGDSNRGHMWRKMPHVMLAKVAEAAALRKAFPADLSGAYTREEMDQAGDVVEGIVYEPEPHQTPEIQPVAAVEAEVGTNGHAAQETAVDGDLFPNDEPTSAPMKKPTAAQLKAMHAAGSAYYGQEWDTKRPELVSAVTKGRTTSSKFLTAEECKTITDGINRKATAASA